MASLLSPAAPVRLQSKVNPCNVHALLMALPQTKIFPKDGRACTLSSKLSLFAGSPFTHFPSSASVRKPCSQRKLVIVSKKVSGLQEAMRIKRERELQSANKVRRRPPLRRGRVSPHLTVPDHIPKPPYVGSPELPELASEYQIHDPEGIARMREACELASRVLDYAGTLVRPSVTTDEIDKAVHHMIIEAGAYPSPLGYGRFPRKLLSDKEKNRKELAILVRNLHCRRRRAGIVLLSDSVLPLRSPSPPYPFAAISNSSFFCPHFSWKTHPIPVQIPSSIYSQKLGFFP